jgi:FG-GAP-like repeat
MFAAPVMEPSSGVGIPFALAQLSPPAVEIIAARQVGSGGLQLYTRNADGSFADGPAYAPGFAPAADPDWLQLVDVDGDGHLDVAVQDSLTGAINVFLNDGNGGLGPAIVTPFPAHGTFALGDVDLDGKVDLVTASTDGLGVLVGNGDGTFQAPVLFPLAQTSCPTCTFGYVIRLADMNGDGKLDVVAIAVADNGGSMAKLTIQVLYNTM